MNAGQIPVITVDTKDAFTYLEYAVIRGFEHQYIHGHSKRDVTYI